MRITKKYALSAFAGVSMVGALAGCSSATTQPEIQPAPASSAGTQGSGAPTASGSFKDGTYSADGSYQSPAGTGTITVKLTLANGIVTAISTNGHASDPTAKSYQDDFASGIAGKVVGKKINSLNVTNVSGSSLTSGGFDAAIKLIEASARA